MIYHSKSFITDEDIKRVERVLSRNYVGSGQEVQRLEYSFKKRFERKFAIAVTSGSAALELSIRALSMHRRAEIVTSVYVCSAVVNVILKTEHIPAFIDVAENDVNIDTHALNAYVGKHRKVGAVIVPYIGGYATAIPEALNNDIPVIEDCAASIGAHTPDGEVGKRGTLSIFSFGSTKMITGGSGGMILTDSASYSARIRELMAYDEPKAIRSACGSNFYMNDIQAALTTSQLERLDSIVASRRIIAETYDKVLSSGIGVAKVQKQDGVDPSYYRYVFFAKNKKKILGCLRTNQIDARGSIAHFMGAYFVLPQQQRVHAERLERELISLPIYPNLTRREQKTVLTILKEAIA